MCECVDYMNTPLPFRVECVPCWVGPVVEDGNPSCGDLVRVSRDGEGSYIVRRENLKEVLKLLTGPIPTPKP